MAADTGLALIQDIANEEGLVGELARELLNGRPDQTIAARRSGQAIHISSQMLDALNRRLSFGSLRAGKSQVLTQFHVARTINQQNLARGCDSTRRTQQHEAAAVEIAIGDSDAGSYVMLLE